MPAKKSGKRTSNTKRATRSAKSTKRTATARPSRRPANPLAAAMATRTPRPIDRLLIRAPEPAKKLA